LAHSDAPPDADSTAAQFPLERPAHLGASSNSESASRDPKERTILDDLAIRRALMRIAHEIVESTDDPGRLYLVAIPNGGVPLGRILADNLESLTGLRAPLGILDTTLYRDDLSTRSSRPRLRRTEMPSSVDDRVVVLVEDVVSTGRTIRAGMDALMDFGRPSHVRVVALVDRGHRELPIKIDFVGKNIPTQPNEKVIFRADEPEESEGPLGSGVGKLHLIVRGENAS
jgi:pyrimidine operon attenuation protein/uracil phosphoribosyltransferase